MAHMMYPFCYIIQSRPSKCYISRGEGDESLSEEAFRRFSLSPLDFFIQVVSV